MLELDPEEPPVTRDLSGSSSSAYSVSGPLDEDAGSALDDSGPGAACVVLALGVAETAWRKSSICDASCLVDGAAVQGLCCQGSLSSASLGGTTR